MKKLWVQIFVVLFFTIAGKGQNIYKPAGCSASTGPTASAIVLKNIQNRYHLITMKWAEIEPSPDVFSFAALQNQINLVKSYDKKYALAIATGGTGSPSWLFDTFKVPFIDYYFQGTTPYKLPLWWDSMVQKRISLMVAALGNQFANDTSLALVYVTQMTANGIEGHLNGIPMETMYQHGFTPNDWIKAAKQTADYYAKSFPNQAIAFEVHEVDASSTIPETILTDLYNDSKYCQRIGAAIWWLSGKTTYQANLLKVIQNFRGDKYAQIIGKSIDTSRFGNNTISTAFAQAKELGIRYIEPWYYEYQNNTINNLMLDFNNWTDSTFVKYDTCRSATGMYNENDDDQMLNSVFPNPASKILNIGLQKNISLNQQIQIFNSFGKLIREFKPALQINIADLPSGLYFICLKNSPHPTQKFIKK